jgi:endonuclease-3
LNAETFRGDTPLSRSKKSQIESTSTEAFADPHKVLVEIRGMLCAKGEEQNTTLCDISTRTGRDPFKVLISTILSQRTRDENTRKAASALFKVYKNAEELSKGDPDIIEQLIRPAGFYRVKTQKIREVASIIFNKYSGRVPEDLEKLTQLPGVGRKTANCVLVYGFAKPAIPVDTHVHRISNRIGLVKTKTPEQTEIGLREIVDRRYWLVLNELFVRFGKKICRPIGPRCETCSLTKICRHYHEVISQSSS